MAQAADKAKISVAHQMFGGDDSDLSDLDSVAGSRSGSGSDSEDETVKPGEWHF